jgi:hypothetical protein
MQEHHTHETHDHVHGPTCGHARIQHENHVDYAHDGHLHHTHDGHVDECRIAVDTRNAESCTPSHSCSGHASSHRHGPGCGHEAVPHGTHSDYVVAGHLHHTHDGHCDDHGAIEYTESRPIQQQSRA